MDKKVVVKKAIDQIRKEMRTRVGKKLLEEKKEPQAAEGSAAEEATESAAEEKAEDGIKKKKG